MTCNDDYVLEILQDRGVLSRDLVQKARRSTPNAGLTVLDQLIEDGAVAESVVLHTLSAQFGMELISLQHVEIPPEIRDLVPAELARRYRVIPVQRTEDGLIVATSDPLDFDALDTLRHVLRRNIEGMLASRAEIQVALERYYVEETAVNAMLDQMTEGTVDVAVAGSETESTEQASDADAPIINLVSLVILEAYKNRASDIHLEPLEKRFRVRYRIDGVLHEVDSPPKRLQSAVVSRVKIMAGMKISEKRVPQDGRIQVSISGRELDLRVSTVPTNWGESVVMRILDKQNLALGLPKLGFFSDDQQTFERLLGLSDGMILVTGPTGSGKTTTLYACLREINRPDRKIITVEDPVEYQLSGINQVQVRSDIQFTFARALRAILRQAPNIVMIGEIRDLETAMIATETSLTGHLVFSTLHTNDAPGAVTRLLDIGVKPFLVASSLRAVVAQRLVRSICEHCKEEHEPTETEINVLGTLATQMTGMKLYRGRGCNKCALTGYWGRKGIFELFTVTDEIQRLIFDKIPSSELRIRAREMGMRTLREDGLRKAVAGTTTVEEVLRVTLGDSD